MTAHPPPVPRSSRPRAATVALVALAVVGVGLIVAAVWVANRPTTSGWFAYAPLSGTTFTPVGAHPPGVAALLAGGGALLLGLAGGFVLGRRPRRSTGSGADHDPRTGTARGEGADLGDDAASGTA